MRERLQLEKLRLRAEHNNRLTLDKKIDMRLFEQVSSELEAFYEYSEASLEALTAFWVDTFASSWKEEKMF